MTNKELEIFRTDRPVDVQGLGDYLKGMKLDLNAYNTGKPKGIMFKHASSPTFLRLHNAVHKLAGIMNTYPRPINFNSSSDKVGAMADATDETAKPGTTTSNTLVDKPPIHPLIAKHVEKNINTMTVAGGTPRQG